jgi:hypothetical protein
LTKGGAGINDKKRMRGDGYKEIKKESGSGMEGNRFRRGIENGGSVYG